MNNYKLAQMFDSNADIQEILRADIAQIESDRQTAAIISDSVEDFAILNEYGQLEDIPGIGPNQAAEIKEFYQTGTTERYQGLLAQIPAGLLELLRVNGLGPKSVGMIWRELGVSDLPGLLAVARDGRLERLPGFGKKRAHDLGANAEFLMGCGDRMPLGRAIELFDLIRREISACNLVKRIYPVGSLRRCRETVGDIDIMVVSDDVPGVLDFIVALPAIKELKDRKEDRLSFIWYQNDSIYKPCEVEVFVVGPVAEMAALCYLTPGASQRELLLEIAAKKKLSLDTRGLLKGQKLIKVSTEAAVYKKLGLPYILPTMQDDDKSQRAALARHLPRVVQVSDIRGDLHMHTPDSDGRSSLEDMVKAAIARGYEYICITDHSRSSAIAHGLSVERLRHQIEKIKEFRSNHREIEIFCGCEVDILADGSLDYDDEILAELDYVAASVHNGMEEPSSKNTDRILKAMDNKHVRCISHPTGRYIKYRRPMELDMEKIFKHAAATNTALEISSQPARLDLSPEHVRQALAAGAKLAINTDSHDATSLNLIALGVAIAQKGHARAEDIINCQPVKKFKKWLADK